MKVEAKAYAPEGGQNTARRELFLDRDYDLMREYNRQRDEFSPRRGKNSTREAPPICGLRYHDLRRRLPYNRTSAPPTKSLAFGAG